MNYVLDSWALLAWFQDEKPASEAVDQLLADAGQDQFGMSQMNAGELYYVVAKTRSFERADQVRRMLESMPIALVSVTDDRVWRAADLKARHALAYADAFAAGLAIERNAILVTGDREFEAVAAETELSVQWLERG